MLSSIEETTTGTQTKTAKKTDAVGKKVLRKMRRYFVDDFTSIYGKNKDRWAPERWEEKAKEYLRLKGYPSSELDLAKTILLLRSVQAKNNEKTSLIVKQHLSDIIEHFCIVFDTGNI